MKHPLRFGLIVALATLLSTAVLAFIFLMIGQYSLLQEDVADYLPAETTIALLQSPTSEGKRTFSMWFPDFGYLQDSNEVAIAVLALPGSGRGTVSFHEGKTGNIVRGKYSLTLSDPNLSSQLSSVTNTLSNAADYKALRKNQVRDSEWLFLKSDVLPSSSSLRSSIARSLLFPGDAVVLSQSAQGLRIDSYKKDSEAEIPMDGMSLLRGGFLSFAEQNPKARLEAIQSSLSEQDKIIVEGLFRAKTAQFFGESISLDYDILPLLTQSTQLQLRTESGSTSFVLQGRGTSPDQVTKTLEKLHESIRSTLPTARLNTRTFDDRFPSTVIQSDPDLIVEEESTIGPWMIHAVRHRDEEKKFLTGHNGYRFVISNSADALEDVLLNKGTALNLPSTTGEGMITGAGVVDMTALNTLIQSTLPSDTTTPFLPFALTGQVQWKVSQKGNVYSLLLLPETPVNPLDSGSETSYPATTN